MKVSAEHLHHEVDRCMSRQRMRSRSCISSLTNDGIRTSPTCRQRISPSGFWGHIVKTLQCRSSANAMSNREPSWRRTHGPVILPENWHLWPPVQAASSATSDRTEFLGKYGSVFRPAALERTSLAERFGPLQDPCAALMVDISLAPGESKEVIFVLGQAASLDQVRRLVREHADPERARESFAAISRPVGRHPECDAGLDAGHRLQFDDEPLAAVPGPGLSRLGAHWPTISPAARTGSATNFRT